MSDIFIPRIGAVFSADIAVPEHERVVHFYSRVLGTGAKPLWRADLMNNLGMPIIGLGARTAASSHLPLQWMPHVQVADVGVSVQRAQDRGGSVLLHATVDDGASEWAVLLDPNGAAFGVIPIVPADAVRQDDGTPVPDESPVVGRICWIDLTVADVSATTDFYRDVIGWSVQSVEMKDQDERYADYNMLAGDATPAAGICHARGLNAGLPPVWMIYLPVGDLAASLHGVQREGGKVLKAMQGKGGEYVYAAVQDPVGSCFALVPG